MVFNVAQVGRDAVIERERHTASLDVSHLGSALRVLETEVLSEERPDGSAIQRRRRSTGISLDVRDGRGATMFVGPFYIHSLLTVNTQIKNNALLLDISLHSVLASK